MTKVFSIPRLLEKMCNAWVTFDCINGSYLQVFHQIDHMEKKRNFIMNMFIIYFIHCIIDETCVHSPEHIIHRRWDPQLNAS